MRCSIVTTRSTGRSNACAGPHTRTLLEALRPQIDRYEWFFAQLTGPDFSPTYAEHAAIVRAVRGGTADQIEAAVRTNWFKGAERLARVIGRADPALLNGDSWDKALTSTQFRKALVV